MARKGSSVVYTELGKEQNEENEVNDREPFYSNIMYSWLSKTLTLGYKRPLELPDLPYTVGQEQTREIAETFEMTWSREVKSCLCENRQPKLWSTVIKSIGCWNFVLVFFTAALSGVCRVIQQVLLMFMLTLMAAGIRDTYLWLATSGFIISLCVEMVVKNQYFYITQQVLRTRITSGLIALVYKKLLSKTSSELADVTSGHVINLISKDLQPLQIGAEFFPIAIVGCLEFVAMGALLWYFVSWMALAGMLYLVLIGFCLLKTVSPISNLRKETQFMADQRNAKIKNLLSGIRTVKMNTWESLFERMIQAVRRKEIKAIQKKNKIYGALTAIRNSYPAAACFLSIATLWGAGINLTPATVFTTSLIFKTLADSVVEAVVEGAYNFSLFKVTISRLESFLTNEDPHCSSKEGCYGTFSGEKPDEDEFEHLGPSSLTNLCTPDMRLNGPSIQMVNVSCHVKTKKDSNMFTLLNAISLQCSERELIAITGPAGSGKSSILQAMAGEITVTDGKISVTGKIAYMPQNPWLFSGTVQENIVFGNDFNVQKYHATIEACALIDDFKQLPFRDMTQVGESEAALSGGQRARVSLARTVYSDADIFLLDSPLKAVDAKVSEFIYEKCICGLLSTRPRIHVTHNKKYLRNATITLTMENGCIVSREKPLYKEDEKDEQTQVKEPLLTNDVETEGEVHKRNVNSNGPSTEEEGISTAEEDRETGSVSIRTYTRYFRAGSSLLGILLCFLLVLFPAAVNMALGLWLAHFSRETLDMQQDIANIYIYAGFQFGLFLSWLLGAYCLLYLTVKCARNLHNSMLGGILKVPVLFFDTNPAGRILNRFSKDTEGMDETLPQTLTLMSFFLLDHVFAILLICITNYCLILAYLCCLFPSILLVRYYLRSSVEMKRLEAISASSVYSFVDETISGIAVIRTLRRENQFQETLFRLQDKNNTAFMCNIGASRWMAIRLEGLVLLLLTVAIILSVFITDAAATGLIILYSRSVLLSVFRIACLYTFLENEMTSVERCVSYSQLEPEPGYLLEAVPPKSWPGEGRIKFEDCSLVYYPGGPRVLKSLCLAIEPGEKIGITGRTGAGKSSLVSALFRMPEPEGMILIDGIQADTLNIRDARKSLTIVPQQAFLFGGTLRQNLDPEEKHSDKEIWDVLEKVTLKSMAYETKEKLDCWITENGSNLSGGEQQLICIARALLQDRKIVVFDEAMASMDFEADQLIQSILRKELRNRTILTIAHRLDTILDYDKIVVIDEGQIVEVGSPESLLKKEDGQFYRLYERYRLSTS